VLVPLLLICGAAGSAAIVAYGTSSQLAWYSHGIEIIILSRRLEWPMVALSLALCAVLLGFTISSRCNIWWLIGLSPVLALFVRGFAAAYHPPITLLDAPKFVSMDEMAAIQPAVIQTQEEYVVGFVFDGKAYALPYHQLSRSPLVLVSAFGKRALVVWSMTANCAVVLPLDRDSNPREIEVVSRPADSLLLFDERLGQFIVGVTGRTVHGSRPAGFGTPIPVQTMPFANWRREHPDALVMDADSNDANARISPVLPSLRFRIPMSGSGAAPREDARIAMFPSTQPTAVLSDIAMDRPMNIEAGESSLLLERDPETKTLRAFDRHLKEDLFLTLRPISRPIRKHPEIALVDSESASHWTLDCRAIDGPLKGARLKEVAIEDGLYWGVMKFWLPGLKLISPEQ
jgi:hypothetical protein